MASSASISNTGSDLSRTDETANGAGQAEVEHSIIDGLRPVLERLLRGNSGRFVPLFRA